VADPDPQTMIDTLTTTYTSLAGQLERQMSDDSRSVLLQDLTKVREEIIYWEQRRDRSTRAGRTFTKARPTR